MKYKTKKWWKSIDKELFPMKLEIIRSKDKDTEKIFKEEYQNLYNKMKFEGNWSDEEFKYVFKEIYESYLYNVNHLLGPNILNKITDVRLLALGKVYENEYNLIENDILKKDASLAYEKEYNKIKDKLPQDMKERLHLHDCLITKVIKEQTKLTLLVDCSKGIGNINKIVFKNYAVIEEEKSLEKSWWLDEEIYIVDNQYELHILIDSPYGKKKLGYFTIRAEVIEIE